MSSTNKANTTDNPSMISGHTQYAKGYVSETIGNTLDSKSWKDSGKKDIKEGLDGMKAANSQKTSEPAASGIGGRIEELAGNAAGCEGMEKEGVERQLKDKDVKP